MIASSPESTLVGLPSVVDLLAFGALLRLWIGTTMANTMTDENEGSQA